MNGIMGFDDIYVLPNGVNIDVFKPYPSSSAKEKTGICNNKRIVLFVGNPQREEKNFRLAKAAVEILKRDDIELIPVFNIANSEIPLYLNSSDVLLLTSKYEGGVNVIKEAMACNIAIVSTDVGDVRYVIGDTDGCFITTFDKEDIAEKITKALTFGRMTNGRDRIINLGLDSRSVATKIIDIYKKTYQKKKSAKTYEGSCQPGNTGYFMGGIDQGESIFHPISNTLVLQVN